MPHPSRWLHTAWSRPAAVHRELASTLVSVRPHRGQGGGGALFGAVLVTAGPACSQTPHWTFEGARKGLKLAHP